MGEKIRREKVRKFVDKGSVTGKATSQGQTGIQPSLKEWGPITCESYLGKQTPSLQLSCPFLLLSPALCAEHSAIWNGISWGSGEVSLPSCAPSVCLPARRWSGEIAEIFLMLCGLCSAIADVCLCYHHFFQKKIPHINTCQLLWRKLNPVKTSMLT